VIQIRGDICTALPQQSRDLFKAGTAKQPSLHLVHSFLN
jgi:hypothetical protein